MVRGLLLLLLLWPTLGSAAFQAGVDRTQLQTGELLLLTLTLSDVKARGEPDMTPLQGNFEVGFIGSGSQVSFTNGKLGRSHEWRYRLQPMGAGKLTIPPLEIVTKDGRERTQSVALTVVAQADSKETEAELDAPVTVVATVSKTAPYVRENLIYTVVITSYARLRNARMQPPEPQQVVFEQIGKAVEENRVVNGRVAAVTTLHYRLTPLASGELLLPSAVVEAELLDRTVRRSFDPFGTTGYVPVEVHSNALTLTVKPPATEPWLPLTRLHIEERWEPNQKFRVGEPISRELTLVAEGSDGSQLPPFVGVDEQAFRLYLDRPEFETALTEGEEAIRGVRRERLTLIPQRPGTLELPAIRVRWWDVVADRLAWAEFPARQIEVLPALVSAASPSDRAAPGLSGAVEENTASMPYVATSLERQSHWLWFGSGALAGMLLTTLFWWLFRQRGSPSSSAAAVDDRAGRKVLLARLRGARQAAELHHLMQRYGVECWGTPATASPRVIGERVAGSLAPVQTAQLRKLLVELEQALYGGEGVFDGQVWSAAMVELLSHDQAQGDHTKRDPLTALNPGVS